MGLQPTGYGATELARIMRADFESWGPVIKAGGKDGKILKLPRGGDARYLLSVDAIISVDPGTKVKAGDVIAVAPVGNSYAVRTIPEVSGGMVVEEPATGRVMALQGARAALNVPESWVKDEQKRKESEVKALQLRSAQGELDAHSAALRKADLAIEQQPEVTRGDAPPPGRGDIPRTPGRDGRDPRVSEQQIAEIVPTASAGTNPAANPATA